MSRATAEHAVTIVQDLLGEFRAAGLKQADRFAAAAKWLGIKPRRVRMIRNMEADRIRPEEYETMLHGFQQYLDAKAARLERELQAIYERRAGR